MTKPVNTKPVEKPVAAGPGASTDQPTKNPGDAT